MHICVYVLSTPMHIYYIFLLTYTKYVGIFPIFDDVNLLTICTVALYSD